MSSKTAAEPRAWSVALRLTAWYAAAGFSGHGFMQSPAVGNAVAHELLEREPPVDLSPYRLERFADGAVFPEQLVL